MIVKDEVSVIKRCLSSVLPFIDYWVIVDTGSQDGTQSLILDYLKNVPGELHERPWVNFEHNRNEALKLARGKAAYVLVIDADEELVFEKEFKLPKLNADFYYVETQLGSLKYQRVQLINNGLDWKWIGKLHETLNCANAKAGQILEGVTNLARPEGSRSQDREKYQKDVVVLENALVEEPHNARYVFYLAQSYRDAGHLEKALETYEKRIEMAGWDQEVFWSMLQVSLLKECLNRDSQDVIQSYKKAYAYRPSRVEPLYYLSRYHRKLNNFAESKANASQGLAQKDTDDILFIEKWIRDYGLLLEYSIAAYWTENYIEAQLASNLLLSDSTLPVNVKECVEKNLTWIDKKIAEKNRGLQKRTSENFCGRQ